MNRIALGAMLLASLSSAERAGADAQHQTPSCQAGIQPQSIIDARTALEQAPSELSRRFRLADALVEIGCYQEATGVLQAGEAQHPHSSELQSKLRETRSMLSEQHYFEGLGLAEESARLQRNLLRCTQLADVSACDAAIKSKPEDVQMVVAKGDALLQGSRPAEAVTVYRRALDMSPGNATVSSKLAAAETQRQSLQTQCQSGSGSSALQACQAAWLQGADDEFSIDKRKGILLQSIDEPSRALDAYIAANVLKQDDREVALAIVALTDSTGRSEAMALAARGTALLTLGRAADSASVLRQALALSPSLPGLKAQLEKAEALPLARPPALSASRGTIAASKPAATPARTFSNEAPLGQTN